MTHAQLLRWSLLASLGLPSMACGGTARGSPDEADATIPNGQSGASSNEPTPTVEISCTSPALDPISGRVTCNEGYQYRSEAPTCADGGYCTTDADCDNGSICECDQNLTPVGAGYCRVSECSSDPDCQPGYHCATFAVPYAGPLPQEQPPVPAFACQTAADACAGNADCPPNQQCEWDAATGARKCGAICFGCGRPFLVDSAPRLAPVVRRADWLLSPVT